MSLEAIVTPSGNIFYQDEYDQQYLSEWVTVNGVIDITTTVRTPYILGMTNSGFIRDGILYRRGIVTITRQVLRPLSDGYEIVADGFESYEADIQMNFQCGGKPLDTFKYHLNNPIVDDCVCMVSDGSSFVDIDSGMGGTVWADVDVDGNTIVYPTTGYVLTFIDVWGDNG